MHKSLSRSSLVRRFRCLYKNRFSKLFMSHLDCEFKKQHNQDLKSLVADEVRPLCSISSYRPDVGCYFSFKANKFMEPLVRTARHDLNGHAISSRSRSALMSVPVAFVFLLA